MSFPRHIGVALASCVFLSLPSWAQQSPPQTATQEPPPPNELSVEQIRQIASPVQRLIAVDRLVEDKYYTEAVEAYKEMLQTDPHNAQILNRLGNIYQALQSMDEAKKYYRRALNADSHFAASVNNIGCVYYSEKRYGKAEREYKKAIKMDSSVASFHSNLGYTYLARKKYKEMMAEFHAAVALDPTIFDQHNKSGAIVLERSVQDRGAFYFFLAKIYGQVGDADRCLQYLTKARDEHYKDILSVKTDPAFARVRPKPAVREFIDGLTPPTGPNPSSAAS